MEHIRYAKLDIENLRLAPSIERQPHPSTHRILRILYQHKLDQAIEGFRDGHNDYGHYQLGQAEAMKHLLA